MSVGLVVGPFLGAVLGAVVGAIAFGGGSPGMWGSLVAGAVLGLIGGALWGALLSLGPPAPEDDPLPRRTVGEWTVEDDRGPAADRPRGDPAGGGSVRS
jgi:hypothetical protein